jgi:glycosyltransferase involved in cell wall biosynthesis
MKIFQVFESYPLFYQPYIPPTLELLAQQDQIDSKIIAFDGASDSESVEILPSHRKRAYSERLTGIFSNSNLNYLENKTLKEKVDIIHLQHSFLFNKVKGLLNSGNVDRPKVVITLRGGDTYVKPWISKRWKEFYSDFGNKVDAFIVMSEDQKQYLSRWNVPFENIHVIPISFGQPFKVEPKYPNQDKLKIASVFRMCWEKNIADNLRLIKKIKELGVSLQYDVYGDGPDMGQLYCLLDRYGLNDVVNVMDKVENSIIKSELKNYDFILQLSHSESFGMSIVEAQTYGVPAIVSNTGGLPEVVIDQNTGFVGEYDKIDGLVAKAIELWKNPKAYFEFSKNSIENAQEKYNVNCEVELLKKMYQKILEK